ncbi:BICD family-like cargo adapter 1 [Carcharodon carcharias]|uniref:BICD family-like cargo adapter 1 n=1 Tax=Carcharodon carcharias TaxID=13397 RepID=UPI001B7F0966|nr:BICD family-like cargo adapter 1 [Carcharodon carcharias]
MEGGGGEAGARWGRGKTGAPSPGLEEMFFPFMLRRRDPYTTEAGAPSELPQALWQREQDLQLAAGLGKALLERNEELAKQKEAGEFECAQQLERLEQEKHDQRRRFEARQSELEARLAELESELLHLSGQRERERRDADRTKGRVTQELAQHNERLLEELSKAETEQHRLRSALQAVEVDLRASSLDHTERFNQLRALKAENQMLVEKGWRAEERIKSLREEKEILQSGIETLQGSMKLLQEHSKEQESLLLQLRSEMEQVRTANQELRERVHEMKEEMSLQDLGELNNSLHSEIQQIESSPGLEALAEVGKITPSGTGCHSALDTLSLPPLGPGVTVR